MILIKCVNAYAAVQGLMDKECDYQTAHALVMLRKKLYPHVQFFQTEELKLVKEYSVKDEKGRVVWSGEGSFSFRSPKAAVAYEKKRRHLGLVEVQEDFGPVKVKRPDRITPAQLEALEGFLDFGEVDSDGR